MKVDHFGTHIFSKLLEAKLTEVIDVDIGEKERIGGGTRVRFKNVAPCRLMRRPWHRDKHKRAVFCGVCSDFRQKRFWIGKMLQHRDARHEIEFICQRIPVSHSVLDQQPVPLSNLDGVRVGVEAAGYEAALLCNLQHGPRRAANFKDRFDLPILRGLFKKLHPPVAVAAPHC